MSKAHDPHWRYILLRLEGGPTDRRALRNTLLAAARTEGIPDDALPDLTRFAWPHAIVKLHHHQVQAARTWLPRMETVRTAGSQRPLRVRTVSTSGTIKSLTERTGVLADRGNQRPRP